MLSHRNVALHLQAGGRPLRAAQHPAGLADNVQDVLPFGIGFDPRSDYLKPRLTGYRLSKGDYVPIPLVQGRMPSKLLGLQLKAEGTNLRLYDPQTGQWLATPTERAERLEQENQRLRRELERVIGQRNP